MKIIVLDTETLGRKKDQDRICEIAMLVYDGTSWEAFSDLVKNEATITSNAMAVHHITNEMLVDASRLEDSESFKILKKLNHPETVLVIQNAPFDLGVLYNHGFTWCGQVVDTLVCAKHLLSTPRHALQYLRYELGLYKEETLLAEALGTTIEAHRALGDVIVTKLLLNHLLTFVENNIEALVSLSDQPALLKTIGFGKYKGQSFEVCVKQDQEYFRWCLENFQGLQREARITIEYWFSQVN